MTGLLCTVVWGAAVAKPGAGNAAPIAIGLTVMVSALACGGLSGSVINPARALGPAIVFKNLAAGTVALVVAAQMAGAALAATAASVFYGA
jgi:glycerol uptake facilitator-like aquaporin